MKEFKIRCSAIGQIMAEPRSKADKDAGLLGETAKTYCETWVKEQLYNRRKEFTSKQTEKGNIMEDNSIDFIADQLGLGMLLKNLKRYFDEYMEGTPDVVIPKLVIDAKNSWDCFTFALFEKDVPDKKYYWQAQGYLNLTGMYDYKLIYVLFDTPEHLITREAYFYAKNNGYDEVTTEMFNEFSDKMTYSDIPDHLKIKVFNITRNDSDIERIKQQVIKCRNYIETLKIK